MAVVNTTIKTFGYPETLVREYTHWVVLLRPRQVTIGSLILAAKSEATNLGLLATEEWSEFTTVASDVEAALRRTFDAEKFNYLALMMKDPNVHFHFIPRYSHPVKVNGQEYTDQDWPLKTELSNIDVPEATFQKIFRDLQASLDA